MPQGFLDWRAYNNRKPDLAVGKLLARACPHLTPAEAAAYDAPYPDASFKGGVRRFPNLVPDNPDTYGAALSRRARDWFRTEWAGKTFMAVGMKDPVLGPPVMRAVARARLHRRRHEGSDTGPAGDARSSESDPQLPSSV